MRRHTQFVVALVAVSVAAGLGLPSVASAATFSFDNPSEVIAPESPALASPYPSPIDVSGVAGPIQDVDVTLRKLQHTCERDLSILLVGPGGEQTILMSASGSCPGGEPFEETLTFDQEAADPLPCTEGVAVPSGAYRPARNACFTISPVPAPEEFPAPAPVGPYPVTLAGFYGHDPNGQWRLFVRDESGGGDVGKIAEGWSLTITPTESAAAPSNAFRFGKLKRNRAQGTATLIVHLPGPGSLILKGRGLLTQRSSVSAAGDAKLRIRATGKKRTQLNRTGRVKLEARVSYTPVGGSPNVETRPIRLVKQP